MPLFPSMSRHSSRAIVAVVLLAAAGVRAADGAPDAMSILPAYAHDPDAFRQQMVALARTAPPGLPPMVRLAFADAYIRSGLLANARDVLVAVVEDQPGTPAAEWGYLGLGWIQFAAADFDGARVFYDEARHTPLGQSVSDVVLGLIDAVQRRTDDAVTRLRAAETSPATPPAVRPLARLGIGYAHYWAADFDTAAADFEHAAAVDATSPVADDAAYGAAWSRWSAGHHEQALERLETLARETVHGTNPRHIGRSLIQLRPAALVRASLKRYQRAPIGAPSEQLLALLDADGAGLARAALAYVDAHQPEATAGEPATRARPIDAVGRSTNASAPAGAASPRVEADRPAPLRGMPPWLAAALLLLLLGVVLGLALRSRSTSRSPR